jgi:large conductance mechanosensitive channel
VRVIIHSIVIKDFREFLTKTNALALAVGVIVGAAVGGVVSALVADILMPLIGKVLPGGDWREAKLVLESSKDSAGKTIENAILYGHFLGTVIDFVIIMGVVYLLVRLLIREAPPAPTRQCPECLEMLPIAAKRCRACTAVMV